MSQATHPSNWVSNDDGTFDPEATCPHCATGGGQILRGARAMARCRCVNEACGRNFLHLLWPHRS